MHVRQIERTELNGMIIQHTQTLPEIVYKGCVICFIGFDGDIKCVGTRLVGLNIDEFQTLKTLIDMIEFEVDDKPDYVEMTRQAMDNIRKTAERALEYIDDDCGVFSGDLDVIRKNLVEIELLNSKYNKYD